MPYDNEFADKTAHSDILRNPDITGFLSNCTYLTPPSDEQGERLSTQFVEAPVAENIMPVQKVIAIDGSIHETSIDERLPSTKIGYLKTGILVIDLNQFQGLRTDDGRFVDPFRVAQVQKENESLTVSLPSANIRGRDFSTVRDTFRYAIDSFLISEKTRFRRNDYRTSLRSTLFELRSLRSNVRTVPENKIVIHKCPQEECNQKDIELEDIESEQFCPNCGQTVFPSDCLRIWEEVSEYQSNRVAMFRFMMVLEHILPVHYIRFIEQNSVKTLANLAFFLDGPLALFGPTAWLHGSILKFLDQTNQTLAQLRLPPVLIIGLQKTGQVVDHLNLIDRFIPNNRLYSIDDDYRYRWILSGRDPAANGFGSEDYYGHDFIFKTRTGKIFTFGLPYPFPTKVVPGSNFIRAKTEIDRYPNLGRALKLIETFETELYRNSIIPIALAHKFTAISLVPGGQVLDILTRRSLENI